MELRNRSTGAILDETEFRRALSNVSFPPRLTEEIINDFGYDVIYEGEKPVIASPYQYPVRSGEEQIEGKWYSKFTTGPVFSSSQEELEYKASVDSKRATDVRRARNYLLKQTDWTQLQDSSVAHLWTSYRQELRDIPGQQGFPWEFSWPESPDGQLVPPEIGSAYQ